MTTTTCFAPRKVLGAVINFEFENTVYHYQIKMTRAFTKWIGTCVKPVIPKVMIYELEGSFYPHFYDLWERYLQGCLKQYTDSQVLDLQVPPELRFSKGGTLFPEMTTE